ncbi:glycosyltransferase family 4 protein [Adlercreutzia sp. ZJ304]|uniref:glycosyltransferase family 4 protein n=1 Tax=Adlercreutzia sp. ZJ304 TaxID=2709791 RepID=UPI0013E9BDA5|nr:glycosyltransferase family 4 protein [Adlercreutzia sp. ZJ304]
MRKRILAYSIYYYPEIASVAQIYTELFEALSDDFDITVICAVPCYTGEVSPKYREKRFYDEEHGGVRIIRVPVRSFSKTDKKSRILNILDFWRGARQATRQLGGDFDLVFTYSQPPILGGMLGVYGAKKVQAPLIYSIQDFNPEQTMVVGYAGGSLIHKIMMMLDKRSCRKSSCVIVPGRDLAETLKQRFVGKDAPHCEVINNWTDDKTIVPLSKDHPQVLAFRKQYGLDGKFVIMYSGNIGLYYDLESLVLVMGEFKDEEDVVFAFVGNGVMKALLEVYVEKNRLRNVLFIPYQSKEELVYSLNAADVHLVTNAKGIKGVSCPSKAYGVMATDVPMLAVLEEGSEVWCLVEESGCGICVHTGNYDEFRSVLHRVIDERQKFVEAHRGGRSYLDTYLTCELAVGKYKMLFNEIVQ